MASEFYPTDPIYTNVLFVCAGVYDQDASEELLLAQPNLYAKGSLATVYQTHSFWLATLDAVYQSLVIFYFALWVSVRTSTRL